MIKIESIQTFLQVAKQGSITAAAKQKNLSTMAVSKQVSTLESTLGQPLFERTKRQMKLTEFGESFQAQCQSVVAQHQALDNWLDSQKNKVSGTLKVLAQSHEMHKETLVPWLSEFCDLYPDLDIELDVKESLIDIDHDSYDVYWGIASYLGDLAPSLKRRFLWGTKYGVYASPDYLKRYGVPKTPDDLDDHYVVGYLYNQPPNVLGLQDKSGQPLYKMLKTKVRTVTCIVELAEAGFGLINGVGEEQSVTKAVKEGRLIPVLEDYWSDNAEIFIYYHHTKHPQPKVRAFIDFFMEKKAIWGGDRKE